MDCDGPVATLTICNAGKLNALDRGMWDGLARLLAELTVRVESPEHCDIRCLRVRGEGNTAFAAGGDLEEFLAVRMNVEDAYTYHEYSVATALSALAAFPLPVIAQINGPCIGGGLEIASCCDIRIASEKSSFGAPILKLGFSMYAGEMAHMLAAVPESVVAELLLEGRIYDAKQALQKGLVSRIVAESSLEEETLACCGRVAQGAPLVARAHKRWLRRLRDGRGLSVEEKRASLALVESEDYRRGLDAFFNKEKPCFTGR